MFALFFIIAVVLATLKVIGLGAFSWGLIFLVFPVIPMVIWLLVAAFAALVALVVLGR